jgi:hypothetical protein
MHSTIPLLLRRLKTYTTKTGERFNCIAFPDDGAAKRFGYLFEGFDIVVCGKKRDGNMRKVRDALPSVGSEANRAFVGDAYCRFPSGGARSQQR